MRALKWFVAGMVLLTCKAGSESQPFSPGPWLEDLDQTHQAFQTKYANLEWAVFDRQIDLPALFAETRSRIEKSNDDAEARAAFDRLERHLGDGHVAFRWSKSSVAPAAASAVAPHPDCGILGFDASKQGRPLAALVEGFQPLTIAVASEFPAGIVDRDGTRIGIVKIGLFDPTGYPQLCSAALTELEIAPDAVCDDACADRIKTWASRQMTLDLMAQLRALEQAGAEMLLVDIADNGGGTEWAEAAARMVTAVTLKSARMDFVRGEHWSRNFADMETDLRSAARQAKARDRALLNNLANQVAARKREADTPCDSTPIWRHQQPVCRRLGRGFYATGLLDSPDPAYLKLMTLVDFMFTPAQLPYEAGVWHGPLIILVNGYTASAAEQFAAELQDNHAAVVIGAPSYGAGCGHTNGGTPTTLKNSGGVLELPDCVRYRAVGSNEITAIQPDVLVGLRDKDGAQRQAKLLAAKLSQAIDQAKALAQETRQPVCNTPGAAQCRLQPASTTQH